MPASQVCDEMKPIIYLGFMILPTSTFPPDIGPKSLILFPAIGSSSSIFGHS
jgi:hypothetical protein